MRIQVTGGKGGSGCASFARSFKGVGAPNGGNGGRGGDVFVLASRASSPSFSFTSFHFRAAHGRHGTSDNQVGRRGEDAEVVVPVGTVVWRIVSRDEETGALRTELLADMAQEGQRLLVARGGDGGCGNRAFATGHRSNSRFSSRGGEGDSVWLLLELRLIADVGLVGMPNAGKSSLLAAVSNAQPKIANYPFTTLQPQVGVVEVSAAAGLASRQQAADTAPDGRSAMDVFTMADLPGLVDDAHLDVGLGHSFLQHLHRCPLLLFVIDVSSHSQRDPCEDFLALRRELRLYDPRLLLKPWTVFANQMDRDKKRDSSRQLQRLRQAVQQERDREREESRQAGAVEAEELRQQDEDGAEAMTLGGSCLTGEGVGALVRRLWDLRVRVEERTAREKEAADRRTALKMAEDRRRAREEEMQAEADESRHSVQHRKQGRRRRHSALEAQAAG